MLMRTSSAQIDYWQRLLASLIKLNAKRGTVVIMPVYADYKAPFYITLCMSYQPPADPLHLIESFSFAAFL